MKDKPENISRRDFGKRSLYAGAGLVVIGGGGLWLSSRDKFPQKKTSEEFGKDYRVKIDQSLPEMVIVQGKDHEAITKKAIESIGGIQTFIKSGDRVTIKPNIGWDRVPRQAANSNPVIVKTMVELCLSAGAAKVIVTDCSCNDPRRCFRRSGIAAAAEAAGAEVVLPDNRKFRDFEFNGDALGSWPVFAPFVDTDKMINIPIVKHHNLAGATIAMKNWYGIIGGRRNQLHQNIHESIVDLAMFMKPTLTVLDATRILMTNGPSGGNLSDVKTANTVAVSVDQVAIDAFGVTFLDKKPADIRYITLAEQKGIGTSNLNNLRVNRINLDNLT